MPTTQTVNPSIAVIGLKKELEHLERAVAANVPVLLIGPTGCLSGDTVVRVNRAKKGYKQSLKHLYNLLNGNPDNLKSVKAAMGHFDPTVPTFVRSLENGRVKLKQIGNVVYSGFKKTYTVELENGYTLRATGDHKFLTSEGWKEAGTLTPADLVMCDSVHNKGTETKTPKAMYKLVCNLWFHPHAPTVKTSKETRGFTKRCEEHRLVAEAAQNGLTYEEYIKILRTDEVRAKTLKYIDPQVYHVHHIDGNHKNNKPENLQVLTPSEHNVAHGRSKNFGQGLADPVRVKSVTYFGEEDVYDVKDVADTQNFAANGMIVHNCGKTTVVHHVAAMKGKTLVSIPLHGQIGREELIGKWLLKDGKTYWQDGVLTQAIRSNSWVLFDEINAALPEVLFILHSLLDHQKRLHLPEKDNETIEAPEDFRFFATMNPTEDYTGTKAMNMAFISRFGTVLEFNYMDYETEAEIVCANVKKYCNKEFDLDNALRLTVLGKAVRELYTDGKILYPVSTRDLVLAGKLMAFGSDLMSAFNVAVVNKLSKEEKELVARETHVVVEYVTRKETDVNALSIKDVIKNLSAIQDRHRQLEEMFTKLKAGKKGFEKMIEGIAL